MSFYGIIFDEAKKLTRVTVRSFSLDGSQIVCTGIDAVRQQCIVIPHKDPINDDESHLNNQHTNKTTNFRTRRMHFAFSSIPFEFQQ